MAPDIFAAALEAFSFELWIGECPPDLAGAQRWDSVVRAAARELAEHYDPATLQALQPSPDITADGTPTWVHIVDYAVELVGKAVER